MKGKVIVSRFWTNFFSFGKAEAITIFPFIFVRKEFLRIDPVLLNHERIHLSQALELSIFMFYIWYIFEFGIRYIQYRNFTKAYLNISFEREAYANQYDEDYLSKRKVWSFWQYLSV